MVGIPLPSIIGSSFFEYISATEHDSLRKLLSKGKVESCKGTFTLQTPNSPIKTVLLSCHDLKLGQVDGISIVATDISELSKMHQEMAASLKEKDSMLKKNLPSG